MGPAYDCLPTRLPLVSGLAGAVRGAAGEASAGRRNPAQTSGEKSHWNTQCLLCVYFFSRAASHLPRDRFNNP